MKIIKPGQKDKVYEGSKSALFQKFMIFWYAIE